MACWSWGPAAWWWCWASSPLPYDEWRDDEEEETEEQSASIRGLASASACPACGCLRKTQHPTRQTFKDKHTPRLQP